MPRFIDAETENQVRAQLKGLIGPITLVYFTQPISCGACLEQQALPKAAWEAEVAKMRNVYKAPVEQTDVGAIVDYLAAVKGPK